MIYARQVNGAWEEATGLIVFSPNVYQTAASLSNEQRTAFNVRLIVDMPLPSLANTQKLGAPSYQVNGATVQRTYSVADKTADELAAESQEVADLAVKQDAKAAPIVNFMLTHTAAEIRAKINTDVTDLNSAKQMLGRFGVALAYLARNGLR